MVVAHLCAFHSATQVYVSEFRRTGLNRHTKKRIFFNRGQGWQERGRGSPPGQAMTTPDAVDR